VGVTINAKQPFGLQGKLNAEYKGGGENKLISGSVDLTAKGDIPIPASGNKKVVIKDKSGVGASVENHSLTELRFNTVTIEFHRGDTALVSGGVTGSYLVEAGKIPEATGTLSLLDEVKYEKKSTWFSVGPKGTLKVTIKENDLDSLEVSGLNGKGGTTLKGQELSLASKINSGSYSKADGFSINAKVTLESPGFSWKSTPFDATVEGSVDVVVEKNALDTLKVDGLEFSAEARVKGRTFAIAGTIVEGGMSDGDVHFTADPADLATAVKIGTKSVEVEGPIGVKPVVEGSTLRA
jgi:hypothetical protein